MHWTIFRQISSNTKMNTPKYQIFEKSKQHESIKNKWKNTIGSRNKTTYRDYLRQALAA